MSLANLKATRRALRVTGADVLCYFNLGLVSLAPDEGAEDVLKDLLVIDDERRADNLLDFRVVTRRLSPSTSGISSMP